MLPDVNMFSGSSISILSLIQNLAVGVAFSLILRWHFKRYSSVLSNREEFSQVFPFILLTTVLIITIVKSSLALSLGLVGALSIVRFRTPIKEPEELAYLFISIAIGLGLGANQTLTTIVGGAGILLVLAIMSRVKKEKIGKKLYLSVDLSGEVIKENYLEELHNLISKYVTCNDLRRFDVRANSVEATYIVDVDDPSHISQLTKDLREKFPNAGVTFIDQNQMPHI